MKTKISIIGAGSAVFSLGMIRDLCLTPNLAGSTVSFMDINEERLDAAHGLCQRYAAEIGIDLDLTKTTDRRESLEGAEFVINTALVSGHRGMRDGWAIAKKHGYVVPIKDGSNQEFAGHLDFSNAATVNCYKSLLEKLLRMGVSAIKTDFGEDIDTSADYSGMTFAQLHNLYGLLYQKAAFEITKEVTGEGLIWARAGWAGCQRYPLHWSGDAASTWDGMAGSIRGGLHLGLSGFAFWSHDVPGFMNSWPSPELYVRWTQFGVFTSHLRYHGTTPREPYEYPGIADIVRKWLKLRCALIPYLLQEGRRASASGMPVFRALILHHQDDLWTGEMIIGPVWRKSVVMPLERVPVYVRGGAKLPIYPNELLSTSEMDLAKAEYLAIDDDFEGLGRSVLGPVTGFGAA